MSQQSETKAAESEHIHGPNCGHGHHHDIKPFIRSEPKIGRNEPCPCGSGNKFKKCCASKR